MQSQFVCTRNTETSENKKRTLEMKIERETQEYLHYFCDTVITLCEV